MAKTPCCDKTVVKKGPWTPEEDKKLIEYIQKHGLTRWRTLSKNAGLKRCGKSCRLRWTNYLRPDIKRGQFSSAEEEAIIQLHSFLGNKWSTIATCIPGRTDNEIKNHWNTYIRKKLFKMGIDPVTHTPRFDLQLSSTDNKCFTNINPYFVGTDPYNIATYNSSYINLPAAMPLFNQTKHRHDLSIQSLEINNRVCSTKGQNQFQVCPRSPDVLSSYSKDHFSSPGFMYQNPMLTPQISQTDEEILNSVNQFDLHSFDYNMRVLDRCMTTTLGYSNIASHEAPISFSSISAASEVNDITEDEKNSCYYSNLKHF
ncbi:unnamed protein product [Rhodiola kirilowii]